MTGGAGFIGHHLVDALVGACKVRVLDDFSTGRRAWLPSEAEIYEGDVRDGDLVADAVADADLVLHLAAQVDVAASVDEPRRATGVNLDGTLAVLDAARTAGARVILASSAAVYGEPAILPLSEAAKLEPRSPYGASKRAAEEYARLYDELYGVETLALRLFNVYGPGQARAGTSGVIGTFLERAQVGEPLEIHGDGSQSRDFVHVEDVVRAFLAAATAETSGVAINIGTGERSAVREVARLVREASDGDLEVHHTDPRPGDIEASQADISRAQELLGYEPKVDLEDGIASLVG